MLKNTKAKGAKGITLIALIVTIIVLLILAAVSIATLTGDNGLLNKAQEAKIENDKAGKKEKLQVEIMGSYGTDGKIDIEQLNKNLKELGVENADITKLPAKIEIEEDAYVITGNGNIKDLITMTEAQSDSMLTNTENMAVEDEYGNIIILPAGFKITKDTTKVTEGIVIEDNDIVEYEDGTKSTGNQFVWVPVGKIYTTADETTKESTAQTINLSRYEFADGTDKYQDSEGKALALGTPIDRESSGILGLGGLNAFYYLEDTTEGDNTHAISITEFKNKTNAAGGYYIARYESSYGEDGKANSKISVGTPIKTNGTKPTEEGQLWNNITQPEAATASRNMYDSKEFTSDLVNSYAWDTAIVFIQTFGGEEYETYSWQDGYSINNQLTNTGENGDNPLNINDMASNVIELTTETCSSMYRPGVTRGGRYSFEHNYTGERYSADFGNYSEESFRLILYVQN